MDFVHDIHNNDDLRSKADNLDTYKTGKFGLLSIFSVQKIWHFVTLQEGGGKWW